VWIANGGIASLATHELIQSRKAKQICGKAAPGQTWLLTLEEQH
jgi:hypothetical protein